MLTLSATRSRLTGTMQASVRAWKGSVPKVGSDSATAPSSSRQAGTGSVSTVASDVFFVVSGITLAPLSMHTDFARSKSTYSANRAVGTL